jgi:DNA-directed RNA polymerase specialized sigma24 family protein
MVTALVTPSLQEIEPGVFRDGIAALSRYLQRRYSSSLSSGDIDDLAADSVSQLYEASRRGLVVETGNPTGYLLRIAINNALAQIRRSRRHLPVDALAGDLLLSDNETAARLNQFATADMVQQAMRHARDQDDVTAVRVATYLLDEIQRTGVAPSNRKTAEALGLSHAGVAKALHRLRGYIDAANPA